LRSLEQKIVGYVPVQNFKHNLIIGERYLPCITSYFNKLLILFLTSNTRRSVTIFFPESSISVAEIYLTSDVYNNTLTDYFKEEEKGSQMIFSLDDKLLRLNDLNRYNNTEEKIYFRYNNGNDT
jgi:hypothetical protein